MWSKSVDLLNPYEATIKSLANEQPVAKCESSKKNKI